MPQLDKKESVRMIVQDEKNFCLSVAGHSFFVHTLHEEAYFLCRKYIANEQGEIDIYISADDIEKERIKANTQNIIYQDDYLETLALFRKIAEIMLEYDTFLMHGAVVAYEEKAYMFTAASGTGKTTHIRKWLQSLDGAYVVNGDKPLIKTSNKEIMVCGTPWRGKEKLGRNCMVPLKAIILMERGDNNIIKEIPFEKALSFILKQTYMPDDKEKMKKTLQLLSRLNGEVRFYKFIFNNMKDDAFDVAYEAIV